MNMLSQVIRRCAWLITQLNPSARNEANNRLLNACENGELAVVCDTLDQGATTKTARSLALRKAAENGHAQCVSLLIPVSSPEANRSFSLAIAALYGHVECLRLLIPVSHPRELNSLALRWAADNGHAECVRLLIPVSDPLAEQSVALQWAARRGHAECVACLLPVSDPQATDEKGLNAAEKAREKGHVDVAAMIDAWVESELLSAACKVGVKRSNATLAL